MKQFQKVIFNSREKKTEKEETMICNDENIIFHKANLIYLKKRKKEYTRWKVNNSKSQRKKQFLKIKFTLCSLITIKIVRIRQLGRRK